NRFDDLWHHVFRSYEIDVVTAAPLEAEHHLRNLARRRPGHRLAGFDRLADVVVLAEDAAKVAMRKKDGTRAVPSPEAILLTEVREIAAYDRVASRLACGPLLLQPVYAAVP